LTRQQVSIAKTEATPSDPTGGDATGNWPGFQEDTDGDGTWDLDQSRTHNVVNEITEIAGSNAHVAHDHVGNMSRLPRPGNWAVHYDLTYNAWNRLTDVSEEGVPVARFSYDGTGRRIEQFTDFVEGEPQKHIHYFQSGQQVIESREGSPAVNPESLPPKYQNVWSHRYIDSLVLREEYSSGVLNPTSRLHYLGDANYNVTAVVNSDGQVLERYTYSAYGEATIYTHGWSATRTSSLYANTNLYTGRELDLTTGLYYYRARYYGADIGRFAGRDPLKADIDLYRYCVNNPVLYVDPMGEDWLDCMADCINDNDPIDAAVAKALLLVSGTPLPKAFVASLANAVGDNDPGKADYRRKIGIYHHSKCGVCPIEVGRKKHATVAWAVCRACCRCVWPCFGCGRGPLRGVLYH